MVEFPNHEAIIAQAHEALRAEFEFANRLYNYWLRHEKDKYLFRGHLDGLVVYVGATLNVQACRQYRSIIELCERCEGYDASVIARSLFETALATLFVLNEKLYIRVNAVKGKPCEWRASLPPKGRRRKRDFLTQSQRASIYLASTALRDESRYLEWSKQHGRKQFAKAIKPDPAIIAECDKQVGPKWAYILRNYPFTYSGLSISKQARGMARQLGTYYDTIYYFHAKMSHASDSIRFAKQMSDGSIGPKWFSPINEVNGALWAGTASFLICLTVAQNEIGFGGSNGRVLENLRAEFNKAFSPPWPP